jgi:hypothetical protein
VNTHFYTQDPGEIDAAQHLPGATQEGSCGFLSKFSISALLPLFRARSLRNGAHFYTTFIDERDVAINEEGYVGEGIACDGLTYPWPFPPTAGWASIVPLYRGFNEALNDHFYTTNQEELAGAAGYQPEGIACGVFSGLSPGAVPLFRLRAKNGLHFYTISTQERQQSLAAGFVDEGNSGYVFAHQDGPNPPLYRSYNPKTGGHLYTANLAEQDNATSNLGMRADGISGWLASNVPNSQLVYRAYNPTTDDHFLTIDAAEHQNAVQKLGYQDEGTVGRSFITSDLVGDTPFARFYGDFSSDFLLDAPWPKGLTSNSNYVLNSIVGASCNPIIGLSVTIDVTSDIVLSSSSGSLKGFSFQVNSYSLDGFTCGYQQYVISLTDGSISGVINNYAVNGNNTPDILEWTTLTSISGTTLPAGYRLVIALGTDAQGRVDTATFQVFDANKKMVGHTTRIIANIAGSNALGTAPIAGFNLNFVGPAGGEQSILNPGGSGVITYAATSPLAASNQGPRCAANLNNFTVETANSVYGQISASRSTKLVQSFNTNGTTESVGVTTQLRPPLKPSPQPK